MRTTPLVGTKLWFVPRDDGLGWGWRSASWEGHLALAVFVVVAIGSSVVFDGAAVGGALAVAVAAFVATAVVKGTTRGGRRQAEQVREATDRSKRDDVSS